MTHPPLSLQFNTLSPPRDQYHKRGTCPTYVPLSCSTRCGYEVRRTDGNWTVWMRGWLVGRWFWWFCLVVHLWHPNRVCPAEGLWVSGAKLQWDTHSTYFGSLLCNHEWIRNSFAFVGELHFWMSIKKGPKGAKF